MPGTFYRTYRPQKFSELIGQEVICSTLKQAIKEQKMASAYLFTGPRGTGKTTTARIFAKAVNCLTLRKERGSSSKKKLVEPCDRCINCLAINEGKALDLIEIDAASYTGVDNIRQLTENIDISPVQMPYKIFIIDEVHMLSKGAFNALLKTLEEPPLHSIFILATTEQHRVLATIASRCQRFNFRLLNLPEISGKLAQIAKKEKIEIDDASLDLISEVAQGGMRDAESLFSQIATLAGKKIDLKETQAILGIAGRTEETNLLKLIIQKEAFEVIQELEKMVSNGTDIFTLSNRFLQLLRQIIFLKINPKGEKFLKKEISQKQIENLKEIADLTDIADFINLATKIFQSQLLLKNNSFPHLILEVTLTEWILSHNLKELPDTHNSSEIKNDIDAEDSPAAKLSIKNIPSIKKQFEKKTKKEPSKEILDPKQTGTKKEKELPEKTTTDKLDKNIFDLKAILGSWNQLLQNIREFQPALISSLRVCSPVRIEGDSLILSTPYKFHKDQLCNGRNRDILCQELEKITGLRKVQILEDNNLPIKETKDEDLLEQTKNLLQF